MRAKIGVISDTHGDLDGWERCMDTIFRDAELIIHGGDILYHGPKNPMVRGYRPPALAEAINGAGVPYFWVYGPNQGDTCPHLDPP